MCQRTVFSRSASRIAEEVQLKAEEEFMLEALKMIKQQRNCLQIERLHLESLKQQLMNPIDTNEETEQPSEPGSSSSNPSKSKPKELMSAVDMMNLGSKKRKGPDPDIDDDVQCNNQELNLNLNASGPGSLKFPFNRYDYNSDDGSSSDASDGENVMIDINMLMNGNNGK